MINHNEKLNESIKQRALKAISMYGDLRWCNAKICGCLGCVNHSMSKEEYNIALTIPEVKEAIQKRNTPQGAIFKLNWVRGLNE